MPYPFESFSELKQDLFVYYQLGEKTNGTFLEIGAGWAYLLSNTAALEKMGWTGLSVDINHEFLEDHRAKRPTKLLEADATKVDWLQVQKDYGIGPSIDYLSLDVDDEPGTWPKTITILANLFRDGLQFKVMTVEHDSYRLGDGHRDLIRDHIQKYGYRMTTDQDSGRRTIPVATNEDWWVKLGWDKLA